MNLVIDNGNSRTKVALFEAGRLLEMIIPEIPDPVHLEAFVAGRPVRRAILSSVGSFPEETREFLRSTFDLLEFTRDLPFPFHNRYESPETLGLDRIAAVLGAMQLFPGKNCLVIDAGTCITYDLVTADKDYYGGAISPGIRLRFEALHNFTARLPLVELENNFSDQIGKDTRRSILSGVQNGVLHEVEGFISHFRSQHPELQVLVCGGDLNFFDAHLKNSIFAQPDLVLIGLNTVLDNTHD
jgi:type III pantothenate kinase